MMKHKPWAARLAAVLAASLLLACLPIAGTLAFGEENPSTQNTAENAEAPSGEIPGGESPGSAPDAGSEPGDEGAESEGDDISSDADASEPGDEDEQDENTSGEAEDDTKEENTSQPGDGDTAESEAQSSAPAPSQPQKRAADAALPTLRDGPVIAPMAQLVNPAPISSIFPDPVLASYIAGQLGRGVDDLVDQAALNGIQRVNIGGTALHDPEGLQYLEALVELRLANNQLTQRFPDELVDKLENNPTGTPFYTADNQHYTNELINLTDATVADVVDHIPPVLLQMNDAVPGQIGTWTILNQYNGVVTTLPAFDGTELAGVDLPATGRYTVVLNVSTNWMDMENSVYNFPVEFTGETKGTLRGTVTGADGQPLAGVTIRLSNGITVTTGANGQYATEVEAGTYNVTASLTGYNTQTKTGTVVAGGTTVVDFTLIAQPGAITGVVFDSLTSAPIAGSTVQLYRENDLSTVLATTTTDANGMYSFSGLTSYGLANAYFVSASADGYQTGSLRPIPVGPGMATEADIPLTPTSSGILQGTVTNQSTGEPVPGATVTITDGANTFTVTTDENGDYSIMVPPGAYEVEGTAEGYQPDTVEDVIVYPNTDTNHDIELVQALGSISGTVYDTDDLTTLPGATVTLLRDGEVIDTTASGTNGEYSFDDIPVGNYTVTAEMQGYSSASRASELTVDEPYETSVDLYLYQNFTSLLVRVVDYYDSTLPIPDALVTLNNLPAGYTGEDGTISFEVAAPNGLNIMAKKAGYLPDSRNVTTAPGVNEVVILYLRAPSTLQGAVVDINSRLPVADASIALSNGRTQYTATDGTYSFGEVMPGEYTLTVSAPGYQTITRTITIEPGQDFRADFALLASPGSVAGHVLYENGEPVAGVEVWLNDFTSTITDADGAYYFSNLPANDYMVSEEADGQEKVAEVEKGETAIVDFILPLPDDTSSTPTPSGPSSPAAPSAPTSPAPGASSLPDVSVGDTAAGGTGGGAAGSDGPSAIAGTGDSSPTGLFLAVAALALCGGALLLYKRRRA